ncbi:hypothetical protein AK812_SmicGene9451 [Symbiodinium microadriaticum]|uniref:Uncharacterized protein n=1 Tax=Symbiodinium microadriaticum TaxID=2951 RepID=A0A1Q9EIA8_SYMMI|nr:hypothetical protein AK812_SmicGene9451 [Symbiodinium microadriaticum]
MGLWGADEANHVDKEFLLSVVCVSWIIAARLRSASVISARCMRDGNNVYTNCCTADRNMMGGAADNDKAVGGQLLFEFQHQVQNMHVERERCKRCSRPELDHCVSASDRLRDASQSIFGRLTLYRYSFCYAQDLARLDIAWQMYHVLRQAASDKDARLPALTRLAYPSKTTGPPKHLPGHPFWSLASLKDKSKALNGIQGFLEKFKATHQHVYDFAGNVSDIDRENNHDNARLAVSNGPARRAGREALIDALAVSAQQVELWEIPDETRLLAPQDMTIHLDLNLQIAGIDPDVFPQVTPDQNQLQHPKSYPVWLVFRLLWRNFRLQFLEADRDYVLLGKRLNKDTGSFAELSAKQLVVEVKKHAAPRAVISFSLWEAAARSDGRKIDGFRQRVLFLRPTETLRVVATLQEAHILLVEKPQEISAPVISVLTGLRSLMAVRTAREGEFRVANATTAPADVEVGEYKRNKVYVRCLRHSAAEAAPDSRVTGKARGGYMNAEERRQVAQRYTATFGHNIVDIFRKRTWGIKVTRSNAPAPPSTPSTPSASAPTEETAAKASAELKKDYVQECHGRILARVAKALHASAELKKDYVQEPIGFLRAPKEQVPFDKALVSSNCNDCGVSVSLRCQTVPALGSPWRLAPGAEQRLDIGKAWVKSPFHILATENPCSSVLRRSSRSSSYQGGQAPSVRGSAKRQGDGDFCARIRPALKGTHGPATRSQPASTVKVQLRLVAADVATDRAAWKLQFMKELPEEVHEGYLQLPYLVARVRAKEAYKLLLLESPVRVVNQLSFPVVPPFGATMLPASLDVQDRLAVRPSSQMDPSECTRLSQAVRSAASKFEGLLWKMEVIPVQVGQGDVARQWTLELRAPAMALVTVVSALPVPFTVEAHATGLG